MTPWESKLLSVLRSWERTPWSQGQCCKRRAVDCRFFVVGVLDELYGITAPLPRRLPIDIGVNNRPEAYAAAKELADRYPCRPLGKDPYEPGDMLMVRPRGSHPDTLQHVAIAGPNKQIWHAGKGGVAYVTMVKWELTHGLRMLEKQRWGQS